MFANTVTNMKALIVVSSWTTQIFQVWMLKIAFVNVLFSLAKLLSRSTKGEVGCAPPQKSIKFFVPPAPLRTIGRYKSINK